METKRMRQNSTRAELEQNRADMSKMDLVNKGRRKRRRGV
jgi:hypothetical protein